MLSSAVLLENEDNVLIMIFEDKDTVRYEVRFKDLLVKDTIELEEALTDYIDLMVKQRKDRLNEEE